jgi:hypothetical protein
VAPLKAQEAVYRTAADDGSSRAKRALDVRSTPDFRDLTQAGMIGP